MFSARRVDEGFWTRIYTPTLAVHTRTSCTRAHRRVRYTESLGSVSPLLVAWARRHLFFPRSNNSWGQPFWELAAARSYCSTVALNPWIPGGHAFHGFRKETKNNSHVAAIHFAVVVFLFRQSRNNYSRNLTKDLRFIRYSLWKRSTCAKFRWSKVVPGLMSMFLLIR